MFDHVGIAVSDLAASERFYRGALSVLGIEPGRTDAHIVEWDDLAIGPVDRGHPATRGLHVGLAAPSREAVHAFSHDDGGCLFDPDGNSLAAVHPPRQGRMGAGHVDHVSIRVRDLSASRRFYAVLAPYAGLQLGSAPDRVEVLGDGFGVTLVDDGRPLTEHAHVAFPAEDRAIREFHAAAVAAGYQDHGAPGERPIYHLGYYAAFVLDPDGHNIELVNHHG